MPKHWLKNPSRKYLLLDGQLFFQKMHFWRGITFIFLIIIICTFIYHIKIFRSWEKDKTTLENQISEMTNCPDPVMVSCMLNENKLPGTTVFTFFSYICLLREPDILQLSMQHLLNLLKKRAFHRWNICWFLAQRVLSHQLKSSEGSSLQFTVLLWCLICKVKKKKIFWTSLLCWYIDCQQ